MTEVVIPVNARIPVESEAARKKLRLLLDAAKQATEAAKVASDAADIYLNGLCDGMGIEREKVEAYDDETGELVLSDPDPAKMKTPEVVGG